MSDASPIWGVALLLVLGPLLALALRRLRVSGATIVGGVLAGLIVGPAILGRIAPETYISLFEGPREVLRDLEVSRREQVMDAIAARSHRATLDDAVRDDATAALARATSAWDAARLEHRRPFTIALLVGAALILLSSFSVGARPSRPRGDSALVAAWAVVMPAIAVVFVEMLRGNELLTPSTALVAAACACGAWRVAREERAIVRGDGRGRARGAASTAALATSFACILALPALALAPSALVAVLAGIAVVSGICVPFLPRVRLLGTAARVVVVPAIAALVAVGVDPFHDASSWLIIGFFFIAEDARWLGAFIGRALQSEASPVATRGALAGLAIGPTMLALVALGVALHAIAGATVMALVCAAMFTDCLAPVRLCVARRLERAEAELDDAQS